MYCVDLWSSVFRCITTVIALIYEPFLSGFSMTHVREATRRHAHITPVLRQLHWLPLRQRIRFKLAGFVFQSITGLAPPYVVDDCHLMFSNFHLRSADTRTCVVPWTNTRFGGRSFSNFGPKIWNSLPSALSFAVLIQHIMWSWQVCRLHPLLTPFISTPSTLLLPFPFQIILLET